MYQTLQLVSKLGTLWFLHFNDQHYNFFLFWGGRGWAHITIEFYWRPRWVWLLCVITPVSINKHCFLPEHKVNTTSWKTFVCNETAQTRNWSSLIYGVNPWNSYGHVQASEMVPGPIHSNPIKFEWKTNDLGLVLFCLHILGVCHKAINLILFSYLHKKIL